MMNSESLLEFFMVSPYKICERAEWLSKMLSVLPDYSERDYLEDVYRATTGRDKLIVMEDYENELFHCFGAVAAAYINRYLQKKHGITEPLAYNPYNYTVFLNEESVNSESSLCDALAKIEWDIYMQGGIAAEAAAACRNAAETLGLSNITEQAENAVRNAFEKCVCTSDAKDFAALYCKIFTSQLNAALQSKELHTDITYLQNENTGHYELFADGQKIALPEQLSAS